MTSSKNINADNTLTSITIFCIFSFKYLLIGVGDAGIRFDDLLIGLAVVVLLCVGEFGRIRLSLTVKLYLAYIGFSVLSSFWNAYCGRVSFLYSLTFDLRLLQYMTFYAIGYRLARKGRNLTKVFKVYLWGLVVAVPLQVIGILPTPALFSSDRGAGNTNGPYELAAVAAFLLCYLGYQEKSWINGIASFLHIVLAASRVTIVGMVVSFYRVLIRIGKRNLGLYVLSVSLLALPIGLLVFGGINAKELSQSDIFVVRRLGSLAANNPFEGFTEAYASAPIASSAQEYELGAFVHVCDSDVCNDALGDKSATIRVYRWATVLKSTFASTDSTLIGMGPSFATTGVDGNFVRIISETGLVGLAIYLAAMAAFWEPRLRSDWPIREYVIVLLVTAGFIDILVAYKAMILLWLWHGLNEGKRAAHSEEAARAYTQTQMEPHLF